MIDSVLAGKPDFIALISPTVKSRAGGEPRVASDPRQAFAFCAQTGGLLVVQYAGEEWLPVVRDLRSLCGDGISLVVAVSPDKLTEVSSLQHAGADEVVPWEGRADAVAWAIERVLSARSPGAVRFTPTPAPSVVTYVAPAGAPPPMLQRGPAAPAVAPARPPAAAAVAEPSPPVPGAAPMVWPATIPGGEESDRLLAAAVAGEAGSGPLAEAAVRAAQKLASPEREAMAGGALPIDVDVVRRAAVLRFRVALALQAVPQPGEPTDGEAVQALLAELDGVLAELKSLQEGAPPELQPGLDALRSGLVSEAIDLTEAVQRLGPATQQHTPQPDAQTPRKRAPQATRIISVRDGAAPAEARAGVGRGWLILLAIAVIAAGGFHLQRLLAKPQPQPSVSVPGTPRNAVSTRTSSGATLMVEPGKTVDPAQLEQFRQQEEARGNVVVEMAPGVWVSKPARSMSPGGRKP